MNSQSASTVQPEDNGAIQYNEENSDTDASFFEDTVCFEQENPKLLEIIGKSVESAITKSLDSRLQRIESALFSKVNSNTAKIHALNQQAGTFQNRLQKLEKQTEVIECELRERNLIITGLRDSERETTKDLFITVTRMFRDITRMNIKPDKLYRIGKYFHGAPRNVRVKLNTISEKDIVMECKQYLNPPIYLNEDEPYSVRIAKKLLRDKRRELADIGTESTIDYKTRSLTTVNQEYFHIVDDKLVKRLPRRNPEQHNNSKMQPQPPVHNLPANRKHQRDNDDSNPAETPKKAKTIPKPAYPPTSTTVTTETNFLDPKDQCNTIQPTPLSEVQNMDQT